MVPTLYCIMITLLFALLAINMRHYWQLKSKKTNDVQQKNQPTMFDVRKLLMEGKKDSAIELYCQIFKTTPNIAKKDIDELQRSLKV